MCCFVGLVYGWHLLGIIEMCIGISPRLVSWSSRQSWARSGLCLGSSFFAFVFGSWSAFAFAFAFAPLPWFGRLLLCSFLWLWIDFGLDQRFCDGSGFCKFKFLLLYLLEQLLIMRFLFFEHFGLGFRVSLHGFLSLLQLFWHFKCHLDGCILVLLLVGSLIVWFVGV